MNKQIKFDIIERKKSTHVFINLLILFIYIVYTINTEVGSIHRIVAPIYLILSLFYLFWYKLSLKYLKLVGYFLIKEENIEVHIKDKTTLFPYSIDNNIEIRISGYTGKHESIYSFTNHEGTRNFLYIKQGKEKLSYEFIIKKGKLIKSLIYLLNYYKINNIKVINDMNSKRLYPR